MARKHGFLLLAGLVVGLMISGRYAILAQDRAVPPKANARPGPQPKTSELPPDSPEISGVPDERPTLPRVANESAQAVSLQDALLRPYRFPFSRPTSLEQVCAHLRETLKGGVVLDRAALDRKSVGLDDAVQLELDGVRLKTGLKLLLDQVGLTYRVVAEDNLMIITDDEGSADPGEKIWAELRALHRDLHAVQDAVDDLGEYLEVDVGGPRVRKPTIIEDLPENAGDKPGLAPAKPGRGADKSQGTGVPEQGSRPMPSRVPLAGPRRRL
jgi:hypothetical protein